MRDRGGEVGAEFCLLGNQILAEILRYTSTFLPLLATPDPAISVSRRSNDGYGSSKPWANSRIKGWRISRRSQEMDWWGPSTSATHTMARGKLLLLLESNTELTKAL